MDLFVGKRHRDEPVGLGRVAALAHLRPGAGGARRAMVAVRNVQRRNAREGIHQLGGLPRPHLPHRVMHRVVRAEVVDRRVGGDRAAQAVDFVRRLVGQEHDAGLRAQLDDVARAIVFLVAPRALVLLDHVLLVLVDREAARDAGLLVAAHAQAIEIERRFGILLQRRLLPQRREILARSVVDLRGVGIGAGRQIDLRARHVEKAERIRRCELTGLFGADDVVGDG